MFRGILRAVAILLIFIVIGIVVVGATGGAFRVGGSVASCPAPVEKGDGPIPTSVRGGYEVSLVLRAGEVVVQPAAIMQIEPDTVTLKAKSCRSEPL
jgi:hypothetical protein